MPSPLTAKQVRILQCLESATGWLSRKEMEAQAGMKGYSRALGAPTGSDRDDSLEARGLVIRLDKKPPFRYRITIAGRNALLALGQSARERQVALPLLETIDQQFADDLRESIALSAAQRRARLARAPGTPVTVEVRTQVFVRNPDVVVEVLLRAAGTCEGCRRPAPFRRRSDGSAYLEVHHKLPLSQGGEDTVENALALCPNCHRERHYA